LRDRLFFITYTILTGIVYILAIPILTILQKVKLKYKESIKARFFLIDNPPLEPDGVWFHSCSYGEAKAIYPILDNLPNSIIRLTTTTQTGYSAIYKKNPKNSRYLPFEILLFRWIKPQKILIVVEAELWYLLFLLAKRYGAKTVLINGRVSDRSYPRYKKFAWLYKQIFKNIDEVYAQTNIDKSRLESLGAKNIKVIGNIKLYNIQKPTRTLIKPEGILISAGSTHKNEEKLILKAFLEFKKINPNSKIAVAPRHPERFKEVEELIDNFTQLNRLSWHRFLDRDDFNSDIILINTLGELINIYAISDIVILGGAFEPYGGHNFAEPAQFRCKIITGEYYFNQIDIFKMVKGIEVTSKDKLANSLLNYKNIDKAEIKRNTDIEPILKSIEKELKNGKSV
jgi:3-deoxy-D-manno-octulosonic-acid transferase